MEEEELYIKDPEFIMLDDDNNELYHVHENGEISYKIRSDISNLEPVTLINDHEYKFYNEKGVYLRDINGTLLFADQNGSVFEYNLYADKNDYPFKDYFRMLHAGRQGKIAYDAYGRELFHIYPDGNVSYKLHDGTDIILNQDGRYYIPSNAEYGTYTKTNDGKILCTDRDGNKYEYDHYNEKHEIVEKDIKYSSKYGNLKTTINGKVSYSKNNHIEFDEHEYNKIMTRLVNLKSDYSNKIQRECNSIENIISSFYDKYDCDLGNINDEINTRLNSLENLKECINYSILTYQACENNLKGNVRYLMDKLFDGETELVKRYKNLLSDKIEDSNNDSILTYKKTVNYNNLETDFSSIVEIDKKITNCLKKFNAELYGLSNNKVENDLYYIYDNRGYDEFERVLKAFDNVPKNYSDYKFKPSDIKEKYNGDDLIKRIISINDKDYNKYGFNPSNYRENYEINSENISVNNKKIDFVQIIPKDCTDTEKLLYNFAKANVINTLKILPDNFINVSISDNPIVLACDKKTYDSLNNKAFFVNIYSSFTDGELYTRDKVIYDMAIRYDRKKGCTLPYIKDDEFLKYKTDHNDNFWWCFLDRFNGAGISECLEKHYNKDIPYSYPNVQEIFANAVMLYFIDHWKLRDLDNFKENHELNHRVNIYAKIKKDLGF